MDFNAKLNINLPQCQQEYHFDMIPVAIPTKTTIGTGENRNHTQENSVIVYILMIKKYKHEIKYVSVDEQGIFTPKSESTI